MKHNQAKGMAQTPLMGWSSYSMQVYNSAGNWTSAEVVKRQSDAMKEKLGEYGYQYINIDAGWNGSTDEYGRPVPSKTLYPDGFEALVDYVHANGQKIGLYSIPGIGIDQYEANVPIYGTEYTARDIVKLPLTIMDYWGFCYKIDFSHPGAQAYIESVADNFAKWGIDFLKFDSVTPGSGHNDLSKDARDDVKAWYQALSKHNIWLEISWAIDHDYVDHWKQYSNGWRIDWDIEAYDPEQGMVSWETVVRLFPKANTWWRDGGPGGWSDFDSLNVGNGAINGINEAERKLSATFWSIACAQFYIGDDMENLDEYGLSLLTNREVLAVNQMGRPGHPLDIDTPYQVWVTDDGENSFYAALFNLSDNEAPVSVRWNDLGLHGSAVLRDLWAQKELGSFESGYSVTLPAHGAAYYKVTPASGSTITVNDDNHSITYDGTWKRNGGHEVTAVNQQLEVGVINSAEGITQSVRYSMFNDTDSSITYTGNWNHNANRGLGDYQDDVHFTEQNGDFVTFTFDGTGVDVITELDRSSGNIDIYLDDAFIETVSCYAESLVPQQKVFSAAGLTDGVHTIKAVKKDAMYMIIDAFRVAQPTDTHPVTQRIEMINDDDSTIRYTGSWNHNTNRGLGDYKDDVHFTEQNGDFFEYTFNGIGADILTELDTGNGDIDIYLDGVHVQTVNAYAPSRQVQYPVYSVSGLTEGIHTIKAVKVSGQYMILDAVRVSLPDLIDPISTVFDKSPGHEEDISVTLLNGIDNFDGIYHGGTKLTGGTDYSVSGDRILISHAYLAALPEGQTYLDFRYAGDYSGDVHYTMQDGDSFTFTFTGTGVSLIGPKGPELGEIELSIDGGQAVTTNAYSDRRLVLQPLFESGTLSEGTHTLTGVKKTGDYLLVDQISYEI